MSCLRADAGVSKRVIDLRGSAISIDRIDTGFRVWANLPQASVGIGKTRFPYSCRVCTMGPMKTYPVSLSISIFLAAVCSGLVAEPKLEPLFNGKDLANFKAEASKEFWRVENGTLICESNDATEQNYLETEKEYTDFILEFDVRWKTTTDRGVDSGIDMRKPNIQLQLGVSGAWRVDMTGSFYTGGEAKYPESGQAKEAKTLMKPEGEWNSFRLKAQGDTFTCWINGVKASEYTDSRFSGAAPLGFQLHGGVEMKCAYRNINIAEL